MTESMSSAEDSPASPSPARAKGRAKRTNGGSGRSSTGSFAKLNPDGSWSKMYQDCCLLTLEGSLLEYSETWPQAGTMQNGISYRLPVLAHHTSEKGCSSLPTPTSSMVTMADMEQAKYAGNGGKRPSYQEAKMMWPTPNCPNGGRKVPDDAEWHGLTTAYKDGKKVQVGLNSAVKMWPTPSAPIPNDGEKPGTWLARAEKLKEQHKNGNGAGMPLSIAAQLWPTPTASLANPPADTWKEGEAWWKQSRASRNLAALVQHPERFPTPTKSDGMGGPGCSGREGGENLRTAVKRLPTPCTTDWKMSSKPGQRRGQLTEIVVGGQLNANWVSLLMGFPADWTIIGDQDGKTEPQDSQQAKKTE